VTTIQDVLAERAVRSLFQPIVDLASGELVAYEALARGPVGPLEGPDALFTAARAAGLLGELDQQCRAAAFRGAVAQGLFSPLTVFVNVEPEVLDSAPVDELLALVDRAPGTLRIVLEITERALSARPAELLRTVGRVRALGWGIALDDVGADSASLAFMPLLRPEVVKLDLRLVQQRPSPVVAEIMNAVNDYAERTGALLLAEGIETPEHLTTARGLGAGLGQGWLFGRPAAGPDLRRPRGELRFPAPAPQQDAAAPPSPFDHLPPGTELKRAPKRLLVELSKQLERQAMQLGKTCIIAATFQEARHFTPGTLARYRDLAARTGFVAALGNDMALQPLPGVRGAVLDADDPIRAEWDVVVVSPHFGAALLARDLGDDGPDLDRTFEYALTYRRETVLAAAHSLLLRVVPDGGSTLTRAARSAPGTPTPADPAASEGPPADEEPLLHRALRAATSGITVTDLRREGQPLVFANHAYARLSGWPVAQLLGRSARHLDGAGTDAAAVHRLLAAVAEGRHGHETLLQYRGPQREPWWSEVHASPVVDDDGRVVQCITVASDVTRTRAAERERERERRTLARVEELAVTDPLTGLLNHRRFAELAERELRAAAAADAGTALLSVGVDGFRAVNDELGHAAGDLLLVSASRRLQSRLRRSDLAARLGGDEFLVALVDLDRPTARVEALRIAAQLSTAMSAPYRIGGQPVVVSVSVGVSTSPGDAVDLRRLLALAGSRMLERKEALRREDRRGAAVPDGSREVSPGH